SMLRRAPEEAVIPYCAANGISQIVWSPLAHGILTGKYTAGSPPPKNSRATDARMGGFFLKDFLKPAAATAIDGLSEIAAHEGLTMAQLALAWVLRLPNVASAIIGATRPEQVDENAGGAGKTLSPDTLAAIDSVLAPVIGG
ncbi:MAG: aldo/keto reductase, partial [Proteobacteria bacterium]|nr:aldo/keto reductase [Pseudomonadota bacterium]